jgi:hypothetical protein
MLGDFAYRNCDLLFQQENQEFMDLVSLERLHIRPEIWYAFIFVNGFGKVMVP